LPVAYTVVARDANGRGVPGVSVTWAVTSGGGSVAPATNVTDGDGVASATHTLGPSASTQSVTASVSGLPDVVFSASAATPPTSGAVTVRDDTFAPTNVVVQVNRTVTWTWAADVNNDHNVNYAGGSPTPRPPNSPTLKSGTYDAVFTVAGLYHYFCNIHANMEGDVRVVN
jgi:plastocyanin